MKWDKAYRTAKSLIGRIRRSNPLILLIIMLSAATATIGFERSLEAHRQARQTARQTIEANLEASKTNLSGVVTAIASDRGISKNIGWNLKNSTKRRIAGFLDEGIAQINLVSVSDCKIVARAGQGKVIMPDCKNYQYSDKPRLFIDTQEGDILIQSIATLGDDGKNIVAALAKIPAAIPNSIIGSDDWSIQVLTPETYSIDQEPSINLAGVNDRVLSIRSTHWMDRLVPGSLTSTSLRSATNGFLLTCFLLIAWLAWFRRSQQIARVKEVKEFVNWCAGLSPLSSMYKEKNPDSDSLSDAQRYVSLAIQAKMDSLRQNHQKRQRLEYLLKTKEKELQQYQKRLGELAELDSLACQLESSTDAFLQRMGGLFEKIEDVEDLLANTHSETAQSLFELCEYWRNGIAERGARKFIRGLAETPSDQRDGATSLDDQLEFLTNKLGNLYDQSANLSVLGHKIANEMQLAIQIASHWRTLSGISSQADNMDTWSQALVDATNLLQVANQQTVIEFPQNFELDERVPGVPHNTMTAALYHVFAGFAHTFGSNIKVSCRMRADAQKVWLILSCNGQSSEDLTRELDQHLEVSKAMLRPYGIDLAMLPLLDGIPPVAIRCDAMRTQGLPQRQENLLAEKPRELTDGQ